MISVPGVCYRTISWMWYFSCLLEWWDRVMSISHTVFIQRLKVNNSPGTSVWLSHPNCTVAPGGGNIWFNLFDHTECDISVKLFFHLFSPVNRYSGRCMDGSGFCFRIHVNVNGWSTHHGQWLMRTTVESWSCIPVQKPLSHAGCVFTSGFKWQLSWAVT